MSDGIRRWAAFSPCLTWRYTLAREWNESLPRLLFILLNPSIADATYDDPTNRRGIGFAKRWGYGSVVFVNLFAFRTPFPIEMKRADDPVGPDNNRWIRIEVAHSDRTIAAWGTHGKFRKRDRQVMRMVQGMDCLGRNKDGSPRHPLYLSANTKPMPFTSLTPVHVEVIPK